jgi:nucleoside-diphosphate-sugar epimerase
MPLANVFITGGAGYMGRRLIPALVTRGHRVTLSARARN